MAPLVDLTSRGLARLIEGKTPEEIRDTFHLPDDLTEEEKLEPVSNIKDDPRIRLLNRLFARKRRDLHDKRTLTNGEAGGSSGTQDGRSVDELLEFIESKAEGGDGKGAKGGKKRKPKKKGVQGEGVASGAGDRDPSQTPSSSRDDSAPLPLAGGEGRSRHDSAASAAAAAAAAPQSHGSDLGEMDPASPASDRAARAARRRAAAASSSSSSGLGPGTPFGASRAEAPAGHDSGAGAADDTERSDLDAELFALLDRDWGGAPRHEAAPARSERIASGAGVGPGPLSEELKALAATAEALVQIQAGLSREALPESAAAKVQGMLNLQLRLASQLNELAERAKAGERRGNTNEEAPLGGSVADRRRRGGEAAANQ